MRRPALQVLSQAADTTGGAGSPVLNPIIGTVIQDVVIPEVLAFFRSRQEAGAQPTDAEVIAHFNANVAAKVAEADTFLQQKGAE